MPKKKTRSTDVADVRMARETRFLGGRGPIDLEGRYNLPSAEFSLQRSQEMQAEPRNRLTQQILFLDPSFFDRVGRSPDFFDIPSLEGIVAQLQEQERLRRERQQILRET